MKQVIFILLSIGLAHTLPFEEEILSDEEYHVLEDLYVDGNFAYNISDDVKILSEKEYNELEDQYVNRNDNDGEIVAVLNKFTDKLFANIAKFSKSHDLDHLHLPNISQHFLTEHVTLNNGSLNGIFRFTRNGDVKLTYSHIEKHLLFEFPIDLKHLNFTYNYHIILLFIGHNGKLLGKIDDFRMTVKILFDFNSLNASIKEISTPGMGAIQFTLDGSGVIEKLINVVSKFITAVLHPLLQGLIMNVIKMVSGNIIKAVNEGIHHILHPNGTNFTNYIIN